MINTTPWLSRYRKAAFVQYMLNVLEILDTDTAATLHLSPQREDLATAITALQSVFAPVKKHPLTQVLKDLDTERDSCFRGLRGVVKAYAKYHYDATQRKHAQRLKPVILQRGAADLSLERYQLQTARLQAVVRDLQGAYADAVAALDLEGWVTAIAAANVRFDEVYLQRSKAYSKSQSKGAFKKQLKQARDVYSALTETFNARAAVAAIDDEVLAATYTRIGSELNALTSQYNAVVKEMHHNHSTIS